MSLQKLGTQLIKSQPTIQVQNVKSGALTGGGFRDQTVETSPDLTFVSFNNISGASLYVSGSTSSTSGTFPDASKTGSIVNNPDGSTHRHVCYVTLPAGEYYAEFNMSSQASGTETVGLYNLTNSSWISYPSTVMTDAGTGILNARFTLGSTSNIELRAPSHYNTPTITDLGNLVVQTASSTGLVSEANLHIYKLD